MTIASYSDLLTAVANWVERADLTSRIPEGIVLCEAKMNRYLRTRDMETLNQAFSITGEYVNMPTNCAEVRSFYRNDAPRNPLLFLPDDAQTDLYGSNTAPPKYYSIVGGQFHFAPPPNGTYTATIVYTLKVPALTGANTTNWMITAHPDAYLYGVKAEMLGLLEDPAADKWSQMFYGVMGEIQDDANRSKWGGNGMATRADRVV